MSSRRTEYYRLNQAFLINLKKVVDFIHSFESPYRNYIVSWIRRLKKMEHGETEMRLRNDLTLQLLLMSERGLLQDPFNEMPPPIIDENIRHKFFHTDYEQVDYEPSQLDEAETGAARKCEKTVKLNELFERSPDQGNFLQMQPVPRNGAFCYLAVVNRRPE